MTLPSLVVLTDRRQAEAAGHTLIEAAVGAVDGGARALLLREKDLPVVERIGLAAILTGVLHEVGGRLIVASDAELALRVGADGVHLANDEPWPDRQQFPAEFLVGRSCHNRADIGEAIDSNASYITLSPIFLTESKPGYGPALGTAALAGLPIPTFALGGVTAERAAACREAGATGVAVMGAIMRADDPRVEVARFVEALDAVATGAGTPVND